MVQITLNGNKIIKNEIVDAMPYMGNKRKLATKIINKILNTAGDFDMFYDLFGGGGSLSIACAKNNIPVHYNEYNKGVAELFKYVLSGNKIPFDWVSREDFLANKDRNDWYGGLIKCCWSFGNNQKSYLFGKKKEEFKHLSYLIVINKDEKARQKLSKLLNINLPMFENRLELKHFLNPMLKRSEQLQNLERLQNLEQLQRLEQLQKSYTTNKINITSKSYEEVEIKPNSVIYCDIPYRNTAKYQTDNFDYEKFYDWALNNKSPVFISEYNMPHEFIEIGQFNHISSLCATATNKVIERLYWNGVK